MSRPRGWNLKAGQRDGDRGRSKGGKAHASRNTERLDDGKRSVGQYWGMVGWMRLVEEVGREAAGREMSRRGMLGFMQERREYSRYIGEMRAAGQPGADR